MLCRVFISTAPKHAQSKSPRSGLRGGPLPARVDRPCSSFLRVLVAPSTDAVLGGASPRSLLRRRLRLRSRLPRRPRLRLRSGARVLCQMLSGSGTLRASGLSGTSRRRSSSFETSRCGARPATPLLSARCEASGRPAEAILREATSDAGMSFTLVTGLAGAATELCFCSCSGALESDVRPTGGAGGTGGRAGSLDRGRGALRAGLALSRGFVCNGGNCLRGDLDRTRGGGGAFSADLDRDRRFTRASGLFLTAHRDLVCTRLPRAT